jgi:hypothetical protein
LLVVVPHTIDDDERLVRQRQRARTADADRRRRTGLASTLDHLDAGRSTLEHLVDVGDGRFLRDGVRRDARDDVAERPPLLIARGCGHDLSQASRGATDGDVETRFTRCWDCDLSLDGRVADAHDAERLIPRRDVRDDEITGLRRGGPETGSVDHDLSGDNGGVAFGVGDAPANRRTALRSERCRYCKSCDTCEAQCRA